MKPRIRVIRLGGVTIAGKYLLYDKPIISYRIVLPCGKLHGMYFYSIKHLFRCYKLITITK